MSIALNQKMPSAPGRPIRRALPWALMWLCLALFAGHVTYDVLGPMRLHASQEPGRRTAPEAVAVPEATEKAAAPSAATSVTLPESKFQQAKIATEPARIDRLPTEVGVVGMIQPNADQQVEVHPRATGIIREVHAVLGQKVKQGATLVILDSPDVGKARLDLRARQRELVTSRFEARWRSEIAANVKTLIPALQHDIADDLDNRHQLDRKERHDLDAEHKIGAPVTRAEKIEKFFANKNLGIYRGTLLQPFADYEIAVHEEEKNFDLRSKNIVGEHPFVLAQHTREGMQAKLTGTIEQVRYDSAQEQRIADQALRQAEAAVIDAAQRLQILGVTEDIPHLLKHPEEASKLAATEDVTRYQINAPFDGNIIKKFAVPSQKADMNDVLFVLADLTTVWVKADINESDVAKLTRLKDGAIRFRATSYPDREFQARLISVGSVVDPQTRTVPILAETENSEGLFKVGMFARILLDSSAVEEALTVSSAAVVEKDGVKFVFVPAGKDAPRTFISRPVEIARQAGDRTVIKAGLSAGDTVVTSGAFFLKSEWILQNSSDED
jgi:membrane fusion protein, heavy metal efflux system